MKESEQTILQRMVRLHQFADLFQQELKELTLLVKQQFGTTVDVTSTSPEEMQEMLAQLEAKRQLDMDKATHVDRQQKLATLLRLYLSPTAIDGGTGIIEAGPKLAQFEECLMSTPTGRILSWPEGFYRNARTKETQLLLIANGIYMIESLPGTEVLMYYISPEGKLDKDHGPMDAMQEEEFDNHLASIRTALMDLQDKLN